MVVVAVAAVVVVVVVVAVAVAVAVTVVEGEILFVVSSGLPSQYCSITAAIATETFSKESQSPCSGSLPHASLFLRICAWQEIIEQVSKEMVVLSA